MLVQEEIRLRGGVVGAVLGRNGLVFVLALALEKVSGCCAVLTPVKSTRDGN